MTDKKVTDESPAAALDGTELTRIVQGGASVKVLLSVLKTWVLTAIGTVAALASDTDGALAANSDTRVATQKATKTYSDTKQARSPAVQSVASAATVTPTFANDIVEVTALAANVTLANPTGTAIDALGIVVRVKDNGTARTISYGTQYRAIGVTLPSTTVVSKTLYLAMIFNNTDTKWDVLAVGQEA